MRPGQQNNNNNNNNKRMRGRNRKGPNPLTRSYESNGPDVKIRGTAQHIAEKYVSLARDAQSSGDRVMAENYLQHAEHYFRVIAAAQVQNPQQQPFYRADMEDDGLDEEDDRFSDRFGQHDRQERLAGEGDLAAAVGDAPQPYVNGNGHYGNGGERPQRDRQESRGERQESRGERQESRGERLERQESRGEGGERPEGRGERPFRQNREDRGPRGERGERRERGERPVRNDLPRFVTGDTPQPVVEAAPAPEPIVAAPAPAPVPAPVEEIAAAAPVAVEAAVAVLPSEEPAVAATSEEEMFRPRRRRASRARTRRAAEEGAEPTLAIDTVDEE